MSHETQSMYETQAQIISSLRSQVKAQQQEIERLEAFEASGRFYDVMLEIIKEHPTLQSEWVAFMATMKLCEPELEDRFKIAQPTRYKYRWQI